MSRSKFFWIVFLSAALLAPAAGFGKQAVTKATAPVKGKAEPKTATVGSGEAEKPAIPDSPNKFLSPAEAKEAFGKNEFDIRFDSKRKTLGFQGMVFNDCFDLFKFHSTNDPQSPLLTTSTEVGVGIEDLGGGVSCMKKHQAADDVCDLNGEKCSRLSVMTMDLLDLNGLEEDIDDVKVGFIQPIPGDKVRSIFSPVMTVRSAKKERADEEKKIRAEEQREIQELKNQVKACVRSNDDLEKNRAAFEELIRIAQLTPAEEQSARDSLVKAEWGLLVERAHTGDKDDITALISELKDRAQEDRKTADRCAGVFTEIAKRYMSAQDGDTEKYRFAMRMLSEARSLKGVSSLTKRQIEALENGATFEFLTVLANKGSGTSATFWPLYSTIMQKLYVDAVNACSRPGDTSCMALTDTFREKSQLPQKMKEADQRIQAQMQALNQALNPQANGQQQQQQPGQIGNPNPGLLMPTSSMPGQPMMQGQPMQGQPMMPGQGMPQGQSMYGPYGSPWGMGTQPYAQQQWGSSYMPGYNGYGMQNYGRTF